MHKILLNILHCLSVSVSVHHSIVVLGFTNDFVYKYHIPYVLVRMLSGSTVLHIVLNQIMKSKIHRPMLDVSVVLAYTVALSIRIQSSSQPNSYKYWTHLDCRRTNTKFTSRIIFCRQYIYFFLFCL